MADIDFFAPAAGQANRPTAGIGDALVRGSVAGANAIAAGFSDAARAIGGALEQKAQRERLSGALEAYSDAVGDDSKYMVMPSRLGSHDDTMQALIQRGSELGHTDKTLEAFIGQELQRMNPALTPDVAGQMAHTALKPENYLVAGEEHGGVIRRLQAEAIAAGASQADIQAINAQFGQGKASTFQDLNEQLKREAAQTFGMQEFMSSLQSQGGRLAGQFAALQSPLGRGARELERQENAADLRSNVQARADAELEVYNDPRQIAFRQLQFEERQEQRRTQFLSDLQLENELSRANGDAVTRARQLIRGSGAVARLPLSTSRGDARAAFQRGDTLLTRFAGTPEETQLRAVLEQTPSSGTLERQEVLLEGQRNSILQNLRSEFPTLPDQQLEAIIDAAAGKEAVVPDLQRFQQFKEQRLTEELDLIERTGMQRSLQRQQESVGTPALEQVEDRFMRASGTLNQLLRINDEQLGLEIKQFNSDRPANQRISVDEKDVGTFRLAPGFGDDGELNLSRVNSGRGGEAFPEFLEFLLGNDLYRDQLENVAGRALNAGVFVDRSPQETARALADLGAQAQLRAMRRGTPGAGETDEGTSDDAEATGGGAGTFGDTDLLNQ